MMTLELLSSNVYKLRVPPWTLRKIGKKDKIHRIPGGGPNFQKKQLLTVSKDSE